MTESPNLQSPTPNPPTFSSPRFPSPVCWLLIITFALFFSLLSLQQHRAFETNGLDVGNVDQALWNTSQGRFLEFSLMTPLRSRLALHVEPILLLFLPFYWLNLGGPELLLIAQATLVALGAWPLYLLARQNLAPSQSPPPQPSSPPFTIHPLQSKASLFTIHHLLPLLLPLTYLLLPTLQSAVLFEFHAVTLAPTFFLFAFWALEQKKDKQFILFILLAMACKEDMPLVVAMIGLYIGLSRRRWRLAGLTIGLSLIWFAIAFFLIQPQYAAAGNIQLDRYAWLGDSPPEMLGTMLTQPGLVFNHLWYEAHLPRYLGWLFFPTAFLALFSPLTLLPLLPTLAINLLSDNPFTWRLEDFHYGAPLAPFLFLATIYGLRNLIKWINLPISQSSNLQLPFTIHHLLPLLLLTFSLAYHLHRGYTPLAYPFRWPTVTTHHQTLAQTLTTLDPDSPLFTQSNLAPHLTHRQIIYTDFATFTDPEFPGQPVDDIILDVTAFENIGGLHQFLQQILFETGDYTLISAQNGILHLQPSNPPTLQSPIPNLQSPISNLQSPSYPITADFASLIRLHGFTLQFNRQEEIQITLTLEALQPLADIWPVLYLLDAEGNPIGATTDLQPGLVWFPPAQWPLGEPISLHYNTLPWHTRETEQYRLALGVIAGQDVWDVGRRLRPTLTQPSNFATRLPADGTLIELARFEQSWQIPYGGPPIRQFTPPSLPHPRNANFNHQIALLSHTAPEIINLQSPNLQSPNLQLTLAWQALTPLPPLIRFAQLIGPDGQVYGQSDAIPDRGQYPTPHWQPGEVVVETVIFSIAEERPAGVYTVHVGLYDPNTGQRLLLTEGGDHVEVVVP